MLSLRDILSVVTTERGRIEGEAIVEAGHILMCGVVGCRDANPLDIRALCLKTSALKDNPHEIAVKIHKGKENEENKIEGKCSCKAGAGGKCKHFSAILIKCYRIGISNLEVLSSTDLKQAWGKSKNSNVYMDTAIVDLCHVKSEHINTSTLSPDVYKMLGEQLVEDIQCEAHSHFEGRREEATEDNYRPEDIMRKSLAEAILNVKIISAANAGEAESDDYYMRHVMLSHEEAKEIILSDQGSERWTEARQVRITASSAYSLFTYTRNKAPQWGKKIENVFNSKFCGNAATLHGLKYEPLAKIALSKEMKRDVENVGLVVNPCLPWLGCSPDGIIWPEYLIEIKCPIAGKKRSIQELLPTLKYLKDEGGFLRLKKKHSYYAQIQINLALTGMKKALLAVYAPYNDSLKVIDVPFDEEYASEVINSLRSVYFNHVLPYLHNKH